MMTYKCGSSWNRYPLCHNNVIIFWPLYLHLVVGNLKTHSFAKWVISHSSFYPIFKPRVSNFQKYFQFTECLTMLDKLYCWISLHKENWVLTVVKLTSGPNIALSRVGSGRHCVTLIDSSSQGWRPAAEVNGAEERYVHGPSASPCSLSACQHSCLVLGILLPHFCVSCATRTYNGSWRRRLYCWISLHNENWVLTVVNLTSGPDMALSLFGSGHRRVTLIDQYWPNYSLGKERNLIIEIAQNFPSEKFDNSLK